MTNFQIPTAIVVVYFEAIKTDVVYADGSAADIAAAAAAAAAAVVIMIFES